MYSIYKKDNLHLFVGTVEKIDHFVRNDEDVVAVKLKDFKGEKITVYFNNNSSTGESKDMRADAFKQLKVKEGSYLSVLARCADDSVSATGIRAKFKGRWLFRSQQDEKETNVILGTAVKPRSSRDDLFVITVPVEEFEDGNVNTNWYDIVFYDGENSKNAEFAKKLFGNSEKEFVACLCGKMKEREYNGKIYRSFNGFRITKR